MQLPRHSLKLQHVVYVALAGFPMAFIFCTECLSRPALFFTAGGMSSTIWVVMWFGNGMLSDWLDTVVSWLENPIKRLIYGIIGYTIYPIVAMYILNQLFNWLFGFEQDSFDYLVIAVVITFIVATILSARSFFIAWRQLAVNEEKIKKDAITSQYEALKNQVNPHFLFNSLNALTSLIYENQDEAAKFVKQLSRVYRYVLDMKDKEVVSLKEELDFLESYMFMQMTRHSEGLIYKPQLNLGQEIQVVPLSIQMLVENAIKHNEISKANPLTISIERSGEYIKVKNNVQPRVRKSERSGSIGLDNIRERYKFLSDKPLVINQNDQFFEVTVPILHIKR